MFRNYLKVCLRHFSRYKIHFAINIIGLGIGLASALLIFLFVWHELSYDRHHAKSKQIYRLVLDVETAGGTLQGAVSALPFAPAMKESFPAVLDYVRFKKTTGLFANGEKRFQEESVLYAGASFFDVFTFPLAAGHAESALSAPFSLVLTEETALKFFGTTDVVGRTLLMNNEYLYTITGVLAPLPPSHLQFDLLLSLSTWEQQNSDKTQNWTWTNFYTYLLLQENTPPSQLEEKLPDFFKQHATAANREGGVHYSYSLQPLKDIYLHSTRGAEIGMNGNITNLYLFSGIAIIILVIACINFVNLTTARSANRAREVGLRKVVGAYRRQLLTQFTGESVFMILVALALALLLFELATPVYTQLLDKPLTLANLNSGMVVLALIAFVVIVGGAAGLYPAVVLSGFKIVTVLKGRFTAASEGRGLRKALVIIQFTASIALIASTIIVNSQLEFLQRQNLGFARKQILVIDFHRDPVVQQRFEAIKQALTDHPAVMNTAASDFTPGQGYGTITMSVDLGDGEIVEDMIPYYLIDYNFLETYGIEVVAGRGLSRAFSTDATEAFLINEAAVAHFGWSSTEQAVGKTVRQWGREGKIIGVVRDFHFTSLHHPIEPLTFHIRPGWFRYFSLNIRTDGLSQTLHELEELWRSEVPHRLFEYTFLDEAFNRQYQAEERFGRLFKYFAALAIVVACLGLFGLATHSAQQNIKEIGIRKVLGAPVSGILMLVSKDFLKLILIAFATATPVTYFLMNRWLGEFAYRIAPGSLAFLQAGGLSLVMALLAIGYHSMRAALADPVKSLRHE